MLRQASLLLPIRSSRAGLHDFTDSVAYWVAGTGIATGLLTIFCRHTSASLLIQESAAPAARRDLERYFERLAPESGALIMAMPSFSGDSTTTTSSSSGASPSRSGTG